MTWHPEGDKPLCEPMISLLYWHSSLGFDELFLGVLNLFQEAQLYLHFLSFLNIAMAYVAEIIPGARQWRVYLEWLRLWLLRTCLRKEQGHRHLWHHPTYHVMYPFLARVGFQCVNLIRHIEVWTKIPTFCRQHWNALKGSMFRHNWTDIFAIYL